MALGCLHDADTNTGQVHSSSNQTTHNHINRHSTTKGFSTLIIVQRNPFFRYSPVDSSPGLIYEPMSQQTLSLRMVSFEMETTPLLQDIQSIETSYVFVPRGCEEVHASYEPLGHTGFSPVGVGSWWPSTNGGISSSVKCSVEVLPPMELMITHAILCIAGKHQYEPWSFDVAHSVRAKKLVMDSERGAIPLSERQLVEARGASP
ncbi:hypothetical protein DFH28DRAFT_1138715 [Melampsora americana]|nr:hypothetical protein DFH28DRAFT_1138715 [Melampsora americana]